MPKLRLLLIVPAAAVTLALTGCTTKIDHSKAEKLVRQAAPKFSNGKVQATSVKCPSDVKAKVGSTFNCNVSLSDGTSGTVTLHIQKSDGYSTLGPSDFNVH
jgi:hypothetical protein